MTMAKLEVLLFDVDGTLADTERDGHRVAFNRAFAERGLDWRWDEGLYGELLAVTGGKERIRRYIEKTHPGFSGEGDLDEYIAGLHQLKTKHFKQIMAEGRLPLRSGVLRLIGEARQAGLRLGIATTTTPANVTALLDAAIGEEANSWFDVIAAGDIVPAKKPAPDIYLWAMEQLGVEPAQCAALEDSENGIKSVRAAGIPTVIITVNGYTRHERFDGASIVVDQLGEPGEPCEVLSSNRADTRIVDLALIQALHEAVGG